MGCSDVQRDAPVAKCTVSIGAPVTTSPVAAGSSRNLKLASSWLSSTSPRHSSKQRSQTLRFPSPALNGAGVPLAVVPRGPPNELSNIGGHTGAHDGALTPPHRNLNPVRVSSRTVRSDIRNRGLPSPERLLRAMLERLDTDLLFRWFVGLGVDDPMWRPTVFSKNRDRLLEGAIAARSFSPPSWRARASGS